jgi:hypothetical protein
LSSGFSPKDADTLSKQISQLKVDATLSKSYVVVYQGQRVRLRVEAFMDDIDSPDLYFFCPEPLAGRINKEMVEFAQARGL